MTPSRRIRFRSNEPRWAFRRARKVGAILLGTLSIVLTASMQMDAQEKTDARTPLPDGVRQVFVPQDELDPVVTRDKHGVLMPRAEFLSLLKKARDQAESSPLNVGMSITSADYQAKLVGEQLIVFARLDLVQFVGGWQELLLPFRGIGVERAAFGDQPARLGRSGSNGTLQLFNNQTGRRTLQLELSAPLVSAGSDKIAAFGIPRASSATLKLSLPTGKHLLIDELAIAAPPASAEQVEYDIAIGGRDEIRLRVTDRETRQTSDGMVFAATLYHVNVSPGEVDWRADTTVDVFGKPVDRLRFTVPKTLEIVDVDSSGLESWELADDTADASRTSITLTYRQPFQDSRRITLRGVTPIQTGTRWNVPSLALSGTTSHVGRMVVTHPVDVRLRTERADGVRPVSQIEGKDSAPGVVAPPPGSTPNAGTRMFFDVWREDFQVEFVTEPKRAEVYADILTSLDFPETGPELNVATKIETVYTPLFEIELMIPVEWDVATVSIDGTPATWRTSPKEAAQHSVIIPLTTPLAPGKHLSLVLTARRDLDIWPVTFEGTELSLPEVRIPNAAVVVGSYVVKAEDDLEVTSLDVQGLDPAHLQIERERLGYRYQDTHFSGKLRIARKPARLSVETRSFTRLEQDALRTHVELQLNVGGGGLRQVDIALPETTSTDIRFVAPNNDLRILEQKSADPANGERIWTLRFDRLVKGQLSLEVDLQLPRGDLKEFQPPAMRVTTAERQTGYIIVEGEPDQRLTLVAAGADNQPLAEVDPVDLPAGRYKPRDRIVGAIRYATPGYRLTVSEERFEKLGVPSAICRECRITSILGRTGEFQHQATFKLTAVGVQSLQIALPDSAELWSTLLDGVAVEARRVGAASIVPLPPAGQPDAERTLSITYLTKRAPLDAVGRLQQQIPRLVVVAGGGQEQTLEILDRVWSISYPRETSLLQSDGRFMPEGELDRTSLLGRFSQSFSVPTARTFWWNLVWLAIACGVVLLGVRSYRQGKIWGFSLMSVVLICIIVVGGVALLLPATQQAREAARRAAGRSAESAASKSVEGVSDVAGFGEVASPASARGPAKESTPIGGEPKSAPAAIPSGSRARPEVGRSEFAGLQPDKEDVGLGQFGSRINLSDDGKRATEPARKSDESEGGSPTDGQLRSPQAGTAFALTPQARGLLSVAINLEPSGQTRQQVFRDRSSGGASNEPELNLLYEDRAAGAAYRLVLAAAIVCGMWFLRKRSRKLRAILGAWGIIAPLALVPVTPVSWHIWLDGVFLGTLGGLAVWLIAAIAPHLSRCCTRLVPKRAAQTTATMLLALLVLSSTRSTFAADPVPQAPKSAPTPAAHQSATAAPAQPAEDRTTIDTTDPDEIRIVVPYDRNGDPLASDQVYIPYTKFLTLWNQAYPEQRVGEHAPLDGAVAGAIYSAELQPATGESRPHIAVAARFVVSNFRDRQITLPLPLRQVAVRSAKLNGESAPLIAPENNPNRENDLEPLQILLDKPGTQTLDVEFDLPAEVMGPAGRFTLPLLPVSSGRLSFVLPGEKLSARVNGSSSAFRQIKEGDREKIELAVNAGGNITVAWQPVEERTGVESTVHAEGATFLHITDAGVKLTVDESFQVRQGSLSEIAFSLPPELQLQRLSGSDLGGWEIAGEGGERRLRVFLRRSVTDETQLRLELFQALKIDAADVPLALAAFAPIGVTRETGSIAVFAGAQLKVQETSVTGATRINAGEFTRPKGLAIPKQRADLAYRYSARPIDLKWLVSREKPESTAVADHGVIVERRKLRFASRFNITLTGAPRSRVSVTLPEEYLVLDVAAEGLSDWFVSPIQGGTKSLVLEFKAPRLGEIRILLEGSVAKEIDSDAASIIVPTPRDLNRLTTNLAVWIDDSYTATFADPAGWRSASPNELAPEVQKLQQNRPAKFAFRSTETAPGPVELNLARVTAGLSGDALALVTVTETAVHHTLAIKWKITRGTAETFQFTTPDWFAGRLEFPDATLRQVEQEKLPDGRTRWKVTLDDPVRDQFFLTAIAVLPSPAGEILSAPRVTLEESTGEGNTETKPLATQKQYVVLVNQSDAQLSAANPAVLEPIDAKDLSIRIRPDLIQQAAEVVAVKPGNQPLDWRRQRLARQGGAGASVNLADLLTVVATDGSWRTRLACRVKNRSRQFLALRLPAESNLLSVYVADQPARAVTTTRNGQTYHLLALPKTSDADLSFTVDVVLAGRLENGSLPGGVQLSRTDLQLPVPEIVAPIDDAEFGIPVVRTKWTVSFPKDQDVEILDDQTRTNLSVLESDAENLLDLEAALSDASSLLGVLSKSGSARARYEAYGNLKEIEGKYLATDTYGLESRGEFGSKLSQQRSQILGDLRKNEAQIQVDKGNQTLNFSNGNVQEFDLKRQIQQSTEIAGDNRAAPVQKPGEADTNGNGQFRFDRDADFGITKDKSDESNSGKAESAKQRFFDRRQKGSQQLELNRQLEEQQQQPPQNAPADAPAPAPTPNVQDGEMPPQSGEKSRPMHRAGVSESSRDTFGKSPAHDPFPQPDPRSFARRRASGGRPNVGLGMRQGQFSGGAGFGGGVGGGGLVQGQTKTEQEAIAENMFADFAITPPTPGGLSLRIPIEIPHDAQKLVLSKPGGTPRLTVALRPKESLQTALGGLWALVWLGFGAAIVAALGATANRPAARRNLSKIIAAVGVVAFLLLPAPLSWLGMGIFVAGLAFALRRPAVQA